MPTTLDDNGVTHGATASAVAAHPLSASVSGNAITVTLDLTTLVFRSPTANSGALTPLRNLSQLSLVISATDSFGNSTASGTRRLAILAINNAGTIELAAGDVCGGYSLDETGVITTAATAVALTTIKAAAVRTGVSYKVAGFIDVPFTTGVGWGALALVQSGGGQALAAMSSLGYGQTWQINGAGITRVAGTTYYNTTGKPIWVKTYVAVPGGGITVNGVAAAINASNIWQDVIVPPGASYAMTAGAALNNWNELR